MTARSAGSREARARWSRRGMAGLACACLALAAWLDGIVAASAAAAGAAAVVALLRAGAPAARPEGAAGDACNDEQLIHSQKMAVLGELSSGIAHEINTPLGIIGQENELLQMLTSGPQYAALEGGEELRERLAQIAIQVERCGEITHQLLDFARKTRAVPQAVHLGELMEDMVRLVEREAGYQNIVIQRRYDDRGRTVRTDPALVRQVVLNLLQNALQAVERDGVVTVVTGFADDHALMQVIDTGCGIAPEIVARVFDPFFTTKPPGQGTGLGLSICLKIMDRLGGRIQVASEAGKGATFTLRFPLAPPERNCAADPHQHKEGATHVTKD